MGALSATGITALRAPFEPFTPGGCHVPNTNQYRLKPGYGPEMLADAVAERIEFEGPETVAAVIMEPSRTPAAASRRPRATSSASARSATATTC
jgi:adenosylmethionine-8-amino-7-oxononanoate aminotransferase